MSHLLGLAIAPFSISCDRHPSIKLNQLRHRYSWLTPSKVWTRPIS